MSDFYQEYLVVFATGLVVSLILTPVVRVLAFRLGAVDLPNERRAHRHPTARGGGLAVAIGVHAACLAGFAIQWYSSKSSLSFEWWLHFMLASSVLLGVGIVDDLRGLKPAIKLAGQILAALLISRSDLRFGTLFGCALPPLVDSVLVIFWIVGVINAFNLIDGLDGLAAGLAVVSAAGLAGILAIHHGVSGELIVLLALIGASLGFLRYNFHPASIFLGDTGSMFLGFTLGVISLRTVTKNTFVLSFCIPMLVLGVPIFDEVLAIWRRSVRSWLAQFQPPGASGKKGLFQPDLEHLHHRLVRAGWGTRRVAAWLCGINACLVMFGFLITSFRSHAAGIFLIALLAVVYVLMRQLAVTELRDTGRVLLNGLRRPTHATFKALIYPVWDMAVMAGALALAKHLIEGGGAGFWRAWFIDLPVWVTPTFSLIAISRTYVTIWTRARVLDVLMLASRLITGLCLSLAVALLIDPSRRLEAIFIAVLVGAISHPAILLLRITYRVIEEIVIHLRNKSEAKGEYGRVLLYGAGGRCQLFLKECGFNNSRSFDSRVIVGLVDDEPALRAQWVYGHQVLGGLKDLERIIERDRITGIVITAALRPDTLLALKILTQKRGIGLSEWSFAQHTVPLEVGPLPGPTIGIAGNASVELRKEASSPQPSPIGWARGTESSGV
jgi:UDP-N-acetylmuramyl pentapeptide phosphotransferase/UDP-N-acetylglucosamine-1-phosphate transferase